MLGVLALAIILFTIPSTLTLPHEDAAILYTYAKNLAHSGVISYIPNGPRAEGATDFGWMILISLLSKLRIDPHLSTGVLNGLAIILLSIRCYFSNSLRSKPKYLLLFFVVPAFLSILVGTGALISGIGGFSSFAQACLIGSIYLSLSLRILDPIFWSASILFILLRPDSLVYYIALYLGSCISLFVSSDHRSNVANNLRYIAASFVPVFIFGIYWILRASYFANPFPLPYYVKTTYLQTAFSYIKRVLGDMFLNDFNKVAISLFLVSTLAFLISLHLKSRLEPSSCEQNKQSISFIFPFALNLIAIFLAQSLYLSRFNLLQNVWDRFHIVSLATSSIYFGTCFYLIYDNRRFSAHRHSNPLNLPFIIIYISSQLLTAIIFARSTYNGYFQLLSEKRYSNIYRLSKDLSTIPQLFGVPTILLTEAGKLSYYSGFASIDAWGLNTPQYSQKPLQDPSEVIRLKPDMINIHASPRDLISNYKSNLRVGRSCHLSGDPYNTADCGWREMSKAIFIGSSMLKYELYVVPFTRSSSYSLSSRHDIYLINPRSPYAPFLRKVLHRNLATKLNVSSELLSYGWK
jgi:hypothetical protein